MAPYDKDSMIRKRSNSDAGDRSLGPPITIVEEDSPKGRKVRRCVSMPYGIPDLKSIMVYRTLDESLHSMYGSENGSRAEDRRLKFDKVILREYARTVGDNPSCSSGPPVSISWEYNILGELPMTEYEDTRPARRSQMEMVLPRKVRHDMLRREWSVTQSQIANAVRQNVKTKNQRRTTVNNLGKANKYEQVMESLGRKVKRTLLFQKPISKQVKDLEAKHNEANRLRRQFILDLNMADEYVTDGSLGGSLMDEKNAVEQLPVSPAMEEPPVLSQ